MKLQEAREILKDLPVGGQQISLDDRFAACQLGIEALKFYECIKADGLRSKDFLLPSETKD